jgi:hypothetical protein
MQLVLTERTSEGRPVTRMTWERIPELEGLPDYQEGVVGFWQWTAAGLYNASGVNLRPAHNSRLRLHLFRLRVQKFKVEEWRGR